MNTETDDVVEVAAATPAHDAITAAREEQANTPQAARIEIPDMHPDAAAEMTERVIRVVGQEAGLSYDELPTVSGHEDWDAVGGSISAAPSTDDPRTAVLVVEIIYLPSLADAFVAMLLLQIQHAMNVSQRGTEVHQKLLEARQGHAYDDGLPEVEQLDDRDVENMGGKPDTTCPDCQADLEKGSHKTDCPRAVHDVSSLPPYRGGAR